VSKLAAFRRGYVTWSQDFRGRGRTWGIFFGFYKTRHILLSDSANCTVLCAVVLTQYRRVTDVRMDRQTDGIAVASTALACNASIAACCKKPIVNWLTWIHPENAFKTEVAMVPENYHDRMPTAAESLC